MTKEMLKRQILIQLSQANAHVEKAVELLDELKIARKGGVLSSKERHALGSAKVRSPQRQREGEPLKEKPNAVRNGYGKQSSAPKSKKEPTDKEIDSWIEGDG